MKAFRVTGLALALDGSEDNLYGNQHLLFKVLELELKITLSILNQHLLFKVLKLELKITLSMLNLKMKTHLPLTPLDSDCDQLCLCCSFDKNIFWYKLSR